VPGRMDDADWRRSVQGSRWYVSMAGCAILIEQDLPAASVCASCVTGFTFATVLVLPAGGKSDQK